MSLTVSICVIAYNEEHTISSILSDILYQKYPHGLTQIILVNSRSEDNTKMVMERFSDSNSDEYISVDVLENDKRSQAAGWNVALKNAVGDVIIRVDAHASIPDDFISKNIAVIESGENISGGSRPNIIVDETPMKQTLLLAESSMFGSSAASYRRAGDRKKYVDSLFHAAYRREVFENVGGFDESLGRTEDNEIHYRIRRAGYKFCFSPDIISYQQTRATLGKMLGQKYGNGKWIGLTLGVCPKCFSVFHFVPFCFVLAIIGCITLSVIGAVYGMPVLSIPLYALIILYISADIFMTVTAVIPAKKNLSNLLLPIIFPMLHISYGIGTLVGVFCMPFWLMKRGDKPNRQIEDVKAEMQRVRQIRLKKSNITNKSSKCENGTIVECSPNLVQSK